GWWPPVESRSGCPLCPTQGGTMARREDGFGADTARKAAETRRGPPWRTSSKHRNDPDFKCACGGADRNSAQKPCLHLYRLYVHLLDPLIAGWRVDTSSASAPRN